MGWMTYLQGLNVHGKTNIKSLFIYGIIKKIKIMITFFRQDITQMEKN